MAENEVEVNLSALSEDIEKLQTAVQQMDHKVKDRKKKDFCGR